MVGLDAAKKQDMKKHGKRFLLSLAITVLLLAVLGNIQASAASVSVDFASGDGTEGGMGTIELLFLFALLALAPSLLLMVTSFTRIIIVFSFLRNALGLQTTPPNQVLTGIALFLTLFIMSPVLTEVNDTAMQPYLDGQITEEEAIENFQEPLKVFMLKQIRAPELNLFLSMAGYSELEEVNPDTLTELGLEVIVPAFITSELKRAFTIGFLLFIPFLVIDMVVSSTLMAMGMVMLPPSMISLPFKVMLFVVVDGWQLLMQMLVQSFY